MGIVIENNKYNRFSSITDSYSYDEFLEKNEFINNETMNIEINSILKQIEFIMKINGENYISWHLEILNDDKNYFSKIKEKVLEYKKQGLLKHIKLNCF